MLQNINATEYMDDRVPLSQSAFLQVFVDQRYFDNNNNNPNDNTTNRIMTQSRRVEINVWEVTPNYFFFSTTLEGQSGLAVLSLRVEMESRRLSTSSNDNDGAVIPLDAFGGPWCYGYPFAHHHVVNQTRFRYEMVSRFGVWVEQDNNSNDTTLVDKNDTAACDYASGKGEWVFTIPEETLNNGNEWGNFSQAAAASTMPTLLSNQQYLEMVANAPQSPKAVRGFYRLFSCTHDSMKRNFATGLQRLKKRPMCYLGDSTAAVSIMWTYA